MRLDDLEYEVLVKKFTSLGYNEKRVEERLQMIDPYVSLDILRLTISPDYLS